ncbi:unnamed protein product [Toxocara canis]|uniref:Uncharacterized protein n=1 Tax=Toxocara canis TaxID=6265 RepID=A0A183U4C9_TOXCA|nr:unnamed protein product [Toxocara canis]
MKSHSLTTAVTDLCDAGDILRQQIAALQVDPSPARLGAARAACSPMAVVKKKTRVESPARLDHGSFRVHGTHPPPADKISLAGCANVEGNAPQQPATPTFRTPETISVCTPEQVLPLSVLIEFFLFFFYETNRYSYSQPISVVDYTTLVRICSKTIFFSKKTRPFPFFGSVFIVLFVLNAFNVM